MCEDIGDPTQKLLSYESNPLTIRLFHRSFWSPMGHKTSVSTLHCSRSLAACWASPQDRLICYSSYVPVLPQVNGKLPAFLTFTHSYNNHTPTAESTTQGDSQLDGGS